MALEKTVNVITKSVLNYTVYLCAMNITYNFLMRKKNKNGATMKCKIKHHNDSHIAGTVSQSLLLAQYLYTSHAKKTQRQSFVLHFSPYELVLLLHRPSRKRKLVFPQCLYSLP